MKKLLSLLLALLLCFATLVACNDEGLTLHEREEPNVERYPVFPSRLKNTYTSYTVVEKQSLWGSGTNKQFQRWVFDDYAYFSRFLSENTSSKNSCNEITKETFETNFIVIVYRLDDYRGTENYGYGNFSWNGPKFVYGHEGYYSITLEYTNGYKALDEGFVPPIFDIIVVPREDGPQDLSEVAENIRLVTLVHHYAVISEAIE